MTTKVEPTVEKCQCKEGPSEGYCDVCNKTAYITEPAHSLISKIPSAYGVGSANLSEQDKWESNFDKAFEGTMCDGTGVDYGDTQREVKDFIRTLLSHSVQEAKAERDREWIKAMGEMEDVGKGNEYNPSAGMKCRNCLADILRRLGCEFEWQQVLGKTTNEKYGRKMIPISDLLASLKQEEVQDEN